MVDDDALRWLRRVNGQLYLNNPHPSGKRAWVAVVRAPRPGTGAGSLIIAMGSTMKEAASAAAGRWRRITGAEPTLH